jgi:ribosomal protein L22
MADDAKKPEETEPVEETDAVVETEAVEEAPAAAEAESAPAAKAEKKPARRTRKKAEEPKAEEPKAKAKAKSGGTGTGERPVVRAHAKYVRTSARKARLVCDHIRGKSVVEARAILAHTPRHVADDWSKLLESAVANAEHNHELIGDELRIHSVSADEGPTLKRFRPRAMGRASAIRKRTSHLSIALTPKE